MEFDMFNLSDEKDLLQDAKYDLSTSFETTPALQFLKGIYLKNCGLHVLPKMSNLLKLEIIDIRDNMISDLEQDCLPPSLTQLLVDGNPVHCVDVDVSTIHCLRELQCGSEITHYVSFTLMSKFHERKTEIKIPEKFRDYLYLPPRIVFDEQDHMGSYVANPEKYLKYVPNGKSAEALEWLESSSRPTSGALDLTSQGWLLANEISLKNIEILKINNCNLKTFPKLLNVSNLRQLELRDNQLKNLSFGVVLCSLESLDVSNNPLEEIDLAIENFPCLKSLNFGSDETNFVSDRVLKLVLEERLNFCVQDEHHRENLLLPSWSQISGDNDSLKRYISCDTLDVSQINDYGLKWKAMEWVLNKGEKTFRKLNFKDQRAFLTQERLSQLFHHVSLGSLTDICISDCGLESLPEWRTLENLTHAVVSGNNLTTIPPSSSLQTLDLTKNRISFLSLSYEQFPCVRHVEAGSVNLMYISFELLKRKCLTIEEEYQQFLIMPPESVFSDEKKLSLYLDKPETFLNQVEHSKLGEAVNWLVAKADFKFRELDLSNQKEFSTTLEFTNFTTMFKGTNLTSLTSLNLHQCQMKSLPDVRDLACLKHMYLSENYLSNLSTLEQCNLILTDITGNPNESVNIDFERCPNLKSIKVGSTETIGLSTAILQRFRSDDLNIDLDENYAKNLLLPPPHLVSNPLVREEIGDYLDDGIFDLSWYSALIKDEPEHFVQQLCHLLSLDHRIISTLKMAGQTHMVSEIGSDIDVILKSESLSRVAYLDFSDCSMEYTPAFRQLTNLTTINLEGNCLGKDIKRLQEIIILSETLHLTELTLSRNKISDVPNFQKLICLNTLDLAYNEITTLASLEHTNLKCLHVQGNPLPVLDLLPDHIPSLSEVSFGSEECQFVQFQILHRSEIKLQLLDGLYKANLLLPHPNILENKEEMKKYLESQEINLQQFNTTESEKLMECFDWLIEKEKRKYMCLNLMGQEIFCKKSNLSQLMEKLETIEILKLSACDLNTIPNFKDMSHLHYLYLQNNNVTDIGLDLPSTLTEIYLQGNPIEGIDFDEDYLPRLKRLGIGSPKTKYLSFKVLRRIHNNTLELEITEEDKSHLVFPNSASLINLRTFLEDAAFDSSTISETERLSASLWVLEHCGSMMKSLVLEGNSLEDENIETLLTVFVKVLNKPNIFEHISVNRLHVKQLHNLSVLNHLRSVDFSQNDIENVDYHHLPVETLEQVDLSLNPITEFDSTFCEFSKLTKLHLGSPETKYISYPLLQKAVSGLKLTVSETCSDSLLFPPFSSTANTDQLKELVEEEKLSVRHVDQKRKEEGIMWMLTKSQVDFKVLDLSDEKYLCESIDLFQIFASNECLKNLTKINLSSSGLEWIPNMSSLLGLKSLDLSNNKLSNFAADHCPENIEELFIEGNSIPHVNIDCNKFSKLAKLKCGSKSTEYISSQILDKWYNSDFNLIIPSEYEKYLIMPPAMVIKEKERVSKYLQNPERYLVLISGIEKKSSALIWLLNSNNPSLHTSLDFTSQMWIFENKIDMAEINLRHIHSLKLSGCGIREIPKFSSMSCLIYLNLHDNLFQRMPELINTPRLEILDVTKNPIEVIDFSPDTFPKMNQLSLGSKRTKFITFRVLHTVNDNGLRIKVPVDYSDYLVAPNYFILENQLTAYLMKPAVCLDEVDKIKEEEAFRWLRTKADHEFKEIDLTGKAELLQCSEENIWKAKNFNNLKTLNISGCQLNYIPAIENLQNLETLLMPDNKLTDLATLKHANLRHVDVKHNPVKRIEFGDCPKLIKIEFGSIKTESISLGVLRRACSLDFQILLDENSQKNLLIPPPYIVQRSFDKTDTKDYLDKGEFDISWYSSQAKMSSFNVVVFLPKILDLDERKITSLKIRNEEDFVYRMGSDIDKLLAKPKLNSISELYLTDCKGSYVPSIQQLPRLSHCDLSGNDFRNCAEKFQQVLEHEGNYFHLTHLNVGNTNMETLPNVSKLNHLEILNISNNPITSLENLESESLRTLIAREIRCQAIDFNPDMVPELEELCFSSNICEFICIAVLHIVATEKLKLNIPNECSQSLFIPPLGLLNSPTYLSQYLLSKEINAQMFNTDNAQQLMKCIIYWVENAPQQPLVLNLTGQGDLCGGYLNTVISKVSTIRRLVLRNCGLVNFPDLHQLTNLLVLDLSANGITSFCDNINPTLEELDLRGNPILGYHLGQKSLPDLKLFRMGSQQTKFLSLQLLERMVEKSVNIDIHHRDALVFPSPVDMLNIDAFVNNATLDLTTIPLAEKKRAIEWVLNYSASMLKTLVIAFPCGPESSRHRETILVKFEENLDKLIKLNHLVVNNLGLVHMHGLSNLKNLKSVDYSQNEISAVDYSFLPSDQLQKLDLSRNPITKFNSNMQEFPELTVFRIGSCQTKYICHALLQRAVTNDFQLSVHESCQESLIYPSYETASDKIMLKQFLKERELKLSNVALTEKRVTWDWLLTESGGNFKCVGLSNESDLMKKELVNMSHWLAVHLYKMSQQ